MTKVPRSIIPVLVIIVGLIQPATSNAGLPTDQMRATVERVFAILNDPALKTDSAKETRRAELRKVIFPRFDFEEMAKRSLGAEWRRRTPEEQKEFIQLFTELLKDSYVDSIESYRGNKVIYRRESVDGNYADVATTVVNAQDEEFTIDYRLNLDGGQWKVYDVIVERISIVNNYRSQFRRILGRSSFSKLLSTIREKVE
jgi:phospholipid transport system substrate-binding protein